jgi:hypothetical protein
VVKYTDPATVGLWSFDTNLELEFVGKANDPKSKPLADMTSLRDQCYDSEDIFA